MSTISILIDRHTDADTLARLKTQLETGTVVGLDCETQDSQRHPGLNAINTKKKLVFDHRRTVMTGYSLHVEGSEYSYYLNLAHADNDNTLSMQDALEVLSWVSPKAIVVAHNAPFELVMFFQCLGVELKNVLCSMQMAVSAFGPMQFDRDVFRSTPLADFNKLAPVVLKSFANYDVTTKGRSLSQDQAEVLGQFISKTSKATHSYRGYALSIAPGYGLKKLVQNIFGVKMASFDETLAAHGAKHMGELTGAQVVDYGADDAYWAVRLYGYLKNRMLQENPAALVCFIKQELPMVQVYADCWRGGIHLNHKEVFVRQALERIEFAKALRQFKADIRSLLPFEDEPNAALAKLESWYVSHCAKKREQITEWAYSDDSDDDYTQCCQVSNPIGNAWLKESGATPPKNVLNLTHYYGMRTILYDLLGHRPIKHDGKVASDADARGKMLLRFQKQEGKEQHVAVLAGLQKMADIETRMKLYLTPYTLLVDPDTGCVYPTISSKLETRRMAMADPNGMQLAKQGESTYIRGFYEADEVDELVISADWSSIELVEIGEFSGDPGFAEVFGQLPYGDLHSGAAADCLAVKTLPGLTEAEFKLFKYGENPNNRILKDISTGSLVTPDEFFKQARTKVGKGSNFNYWYSSSLSTVGGVLGWSDDEMWQAVDQYRTRFAVAEEWRVGLQAIGSEQGFVQLPDGHRYVRHEATDWWATEMRRKFAELSTSPAMINFGDLCIRRLQSRSRNQIVNAYIQGSCSTIAKRSIIRCIELCKEAGISNRVRFMMPVHDELVYSVHKDVVMIFIPLLRKAMTEHPEIFKRLPLDCTVSIGRTFKPYDGTVFSQWELDEANPKGNNIIPVDFQGKKLPDELVAEVVAYMMKEAA
jgi:DNA polymerase I-like protein with 3'-5' exonuclease and polymerase domains